jgi:Formate hydrogenlyase subunit 3/Multisubunit Na+/H+ antiporter, MnhD subunit
MLSLSLCLLAALILAFSGLPSCFVPRRSGSGQIAQAVLMISGSALGLVSLGLGLADMGSLQSLDVAFDWRLPWGSFEIGLDPLGAVFLALVFVVPALGSVYGLGYWKAASHPASARRLGLAYGLLAGSMALVVLARDGVVFLVAWEVMALSAYFAATASDEGSALRRSGWIYLIATHLGTLCLFAMFALMRSSTGSFSLSPNAGLPAAAADAMFVLALVGFGAKAGLVPLHFWLPGAHANAPSHVSAVMSGVMLKMGVYGILRMVTLLGFPPAWWGETLLALGALGAIGGIAFALGQTDLKRVLAYSSVENVGIIAMGAGLGLFGLSLRRPELVALGLCGCLLHVWNHGLFKSLLFLGSGSVMRATGTRDIERLGGLAKRMPLTAALFLAGAVAICGLPPLNGFASELLLYLGFFGALGAPGATAAAFAAAALAMVGALAVACFVRLYSGIFLGSPRSDQGEHASESGAAMLVPMLVLALACACIGLFPQFVLPLVERAASSLSDSITVSHNAIPSLSGFLPFRTLSIAGIALALAIAAVFAAIKLSAARPRQGATWDCGYAAPTGRMQYTASSFGESLVRLFADFARRKGRGGRGPSPEPAVKGYFPAPARLDCDLPDPVLDRALLPAAEVVDSVLPRLRFMQRGQTHLYLLYVLIVAILLLAFGGLGVPL